MGKPETKTGHELRQAEPSTEILLSEEHYQEGKSFANT